LVGGASELESEKSGEDADIEQGHKTKENPLRRGLRGRMNKQKVRRNRSSFFSLRPS